MPITINTAEPANRASARQGSTASGPDPLAPSTMSDVTIAIARPGATSEAPLRPRTVSTTPMMTAARAGGYT